jgi:hypothetical protein
MATNKRWNVKFVAGNPDIFTKVRTEPDSPMMRSKALEKISVIESHDWRGWVEDDAGNRIYETTAEKRFKRAWF